MKMTGMMIVTAIETGFRIALRISRQAIANVAFASRSDARSGCRPAAAIGARGDDVRRSCRLLRAREELDVRLFEAGLVDPQDARAASGSG